MLTINNRITHKYESFFQSGKVLHVAIFLSFNLGTYFRDYLRKRLLFRGSLSQSNALATI